MRFGVFTDLHYDAVPDGDRRVRELADSFRAQNVEFIIELGDLCRPSAGNRSVLDALAGIDVPCCFSLGNHNTDFCSPEIALEFLGLERGYYTAQCGGVKFVFLDANYVCTPGGILPETHANTKLSGAEWPYLPPEQLEWLEREIASDEFRYVICSHQSLANDFCVNGHPRGVANRAEVRKVLERRNARSRRVLLCLNGNDHGDSVRLINGIYYYGLNSASYIWHGLRAVYAYEPEIHERWPYLKDMILYRDALHIIVDIDERGNVEISGMESGYQNVSPADVGMGSSWNGVSVLPRTSSLRIRA